MRRAPLTRLAAALALGAVATLAACKLDEASGLSRQVGDPLLDMAVGPASDGVFPTGSVALTAAAARDTLTVTLSNLSPLPAGLRYQVFLVDSLRVDTATASNVKVASGRLITTTRSRRPVNRDSSFVGASVDTVASTDAITSADTNKTYVFRIADATIPTFTHVVVAVRGASEAAPTRIERPARFGFLSSQYRRVAGTTTTYTASSTPTFGPFSLNSALRYAWNSGSGTVDGYFLGSQVRLNIKNVLRPPPGFQYAGWALDTRTGVATRIGTLKTPVPENATFDLADTLATSPWLTDVGIIEAQIRGDTASMGNVRFEDYTRILIVLEPRGGSAAATRPGGAIAFAGAVPGAVSSRGPGAGKIFGTVTSTGGANRTNSTVYLTGQTDRGVLQVATADASGAFRFRTVSTGKYWTFVIPPGGTAPSDSQAVTIGTRVLGGATVGDSVNVTLKIP